MRFVPAAFENEILKDTTAAENAARAKRRMADITASEAEQLLYKCDPQGARDNDNPGIPLPGYGEKFR